MQPKLIEYLLRLDKIVNLEGGTLYINYTKLEEFRDKGEDYSQYISDYLYNRIIFSDKSIHRIYKPTFIVEGKQTKIIDFDFIKEINESLGNLLISLSKKLRDNNLSTLVYSLVYYGNLTKNSCGSSFLLVDIEDVCLLELYKYIEFSDERTIHYIYVYKSCINIDILNYSFQGALHSNKRAYVPFSGIDFILCNLVDVEIKSSSNFIHKGEGEDRESNKNEISRFNFNFVKCNIVHSNFILNRVYPCININAKFSLVNIVSPRIKIVERNCSSSECGTSEDGFFINSLSTIEENISLDKDPVIKLSSKSRVYISDAREYSSGRLCNLDVRVDTDIEGSISIKDCRIKNLKVYNDIRSISLIGCTIHPFLLDSLREDKNKGSLKCRKLYLSYISVSEGGDIDKLNSFINYFSRIYYLSIENNSYSFIPLLDEDTKVQSIDIDNKNLSKYRLTKEIVESYIQAGCTQITLHTNWKDTTDFTSLIPFILDGNLVVFNPSIDNVDEEDSLLTSFEVSLYSFYEDIEEENKRLLNNLLGFLLSGFDKDSDESNILCSDTLKVLEELTWESREFFVSKCIRKLGIEKFTFFFMENNLVLLQDPFEEFNKVKIGDRYLQGLYIFNCSDLLDTLRISFLLVQCPSTLKVHILVVPGHFRNAAIAMSWVNRNEHKMVSES